jgi:regulatory protein
MADGRARPIPEPGEGRVAQLDEIGGAAEGAPAPVARLDAAPAADRVEGPAADLTGLDGAVRDAAQVASFAPTQGSGDGPGDGGDEPGPAPVALFDGAQLGAARDEAPVAAFDAPALRRGGRVPGRAARSPSRGGGGPHGRAPGPDVSAPAAPAALSGPDGAAEEPEGEEPRRRGARGTGRGRSRSGPPELDPDADPVAMAREICLRLLTDRARTRQELAQALRRKGVPDDAAGSVLERFDEVGLIDDAAFAGQWVRSRHASRGLARRAIAMELRRKGVADEIAGEALAEVDAESEERRARELVDRKLRSLTITTADQRAAAGRRLVGMLARKGYGAGVAYRVVREALAEHGAEVDELDTAEPADD